ncbi:MAG: 3'-5' exonuclease [Eubacteriales bacterium]|nr:3'-5' exonuclease [Eubacteriales bacterium]
MNRSLRKQQVYHFLLGDPGMCAYTDKVIKGLEPEKIATINKWRRAFTKPLTDSEADDVLRLCNQIDALWDAHTQLRAEIKDKTTDPLSVWGQAQDEEHQPTPIRDKDRIYDSLYLSKGGNNASPYARLKAVMDYWCALWFWPIDKADELPSRMEFLFDVQMLLGLDVVSTKGDKKNAGQISMFDDFDLDPYARELSDRYGKYGAVNLDQLRADFPRLRIANEVAEQQKFFHWELEFADVFESRGGFDLVIGNPPWIKMEWNEQAVLGDRQPLFAVKRFTATQTTHHRTQELKDSSTYALYFGEYEGITGQQSFLNAVQNYPDLKGQQTNLFKCFLPQAWMFAGKEGISAFLHPEGVYDDPKAGVLRKKLYPKLRYHFQFMNMLSIFNDVDGHTCFSLNIYSNAPTTSFITIANIFAEKAIDECFEIITDEQVPGLKDEHGQWQTKGHPDRKITIGKKELLLFDKVILSRCGINVKGRSGKLRMNYRTTEEIRHSAMNVLEGLSFDDLDDGIDDGKGYISLSHGDQPTVSVFATQDQEAEELIKRIQEQIAAGIDPREICVVARTNPLIDDYKKYLTEAGIDSFEIKRRQADDRSRMGVRLATMHRVKGLEFTTVFIVAANKNYIPLKSAVNRTDPAEREAAMASERCLLYVAMTRAKKKVMLSAYGAVSDFVG